MFAVYLMDPSLGKVDKESLPQQTLMDILVERIEEKESIREGNESISQWPGVTMNDANEVTDIKWALYDGKGGSIDLQWLPSTVQRVDLSQCTLEGTMPRFLPPLLMDIDFLENAFTGPVFLADLPKGMESMNVACNKLSGTLDLENLPESLKHLYLSTNAFSGTISLVKLPMKMQTLSVCLNSLTGTVDVTNLPEKMIYLWMNNNDFEGETDFSHLPEWMDTFDVSNTNLSGKLISRSMNFAAHNSGVVLLRP